MDTVPLPLIIIGCVVIAFLVWAARPLTRRAMPYTRRDALLTNCELRFYRVLLRAVPAGVTVFAKVRLMDVVQVPDYAWKQYGGQGSGMHCDFVLVDAETTKILLVIELDDKSHWGDEARMRDGFKDAALASAGIALLRVKAAGRYSEKDLRGRIREALGC
jgi:hypothetical protein